MKKSTIKYSSKNSNNRDDKKPLPSYDELREKAEVDMLKINSYFQGKTEYTIEDKVNQKKKLNVIEPESLVDNPEPVLPLLDKHAQGALRRKIVHDQLERA